MAFEGLQVSELQFSLSTQNIAYSEGRQTGIIVDIGELNCYSSAVFEGHLISHIGIGGSLELNGIAGRHMDDRLAQAYADQQNIYFTKSSDKVLIVKDIKEQCS